MSAHTRDLMAGLVEPELTGSPAPPPQDPTERMRIRCRSYIDGWTAGIVEGLGVGADLLQHDARLLSGKAEHALQATLASLVEHGIRRFGESFLRELVKRNITIADPKD